MTFRVDQKVVGIGGFDESDRRLASNFGFTAPVKNFIYTIASFHFEGRFIGLLEIPAIAPGVLVSFDLSRFRPLLDRESETSFTHGADPSSDQYDNRRVTVGASA